MCRAWVFFVIFLVDANNGDKTTDNGREKLDTMPVVTAGASAFAGVRWSRKKIFL